MGYYFSAKNAKKILQEESEISGRESKNGSSFFAARNFDTSYEIKFSVCL